ncbi:MAG: hypothetical protein HN764_12500 [Gammaproteobacteria bacterium]|jgi:hypothetical protein|nr:hypothetical protein [Gammaproteobacteria bacterium]
MTISVIELNDVEIRVGKGKEVVLRSPGYAFIDKDKIELGSVAARQARLQPRAVHNKYWKNLNQEPLQYPGTHARHNADLAFAQLLAIYDQAGKPEEVIIAVPGSYSNDQLALLLGLVEASPLTIVGLVDSAIAAVAPTAGKGNYVYIDTHLHQTILTRISVTDQVVRGAVHPIDGAGLASIYDTTAHLIADLFIKESRFDPQHHPETEQALYDQIPTCLNSLQTLSEVSLEIQYQQTQHQAKLSRESLLHVLQPLYNKIADAIDANDSCLISNQTGQLPGFTNSLNEAQILPASNIFETCMIHAESIRSAGSGSNYVTSLPATSSPVITETPKQNLENTGTVNSTGQNITHILHGHNAFALHEGPVYLSASGLISIDDASTGHCCVSQQKGKVKLQTNGELAVFVNGRQTQHTEEVQAGDIISFTGSKTEYVFIHVDD